jgi:thiosulfate dehydrogenase [quinone] large subunit
MGGNVQYRIHTEAAIAFLLRLSLGMLFLFAGLGKFLGPGGPGGTANWLVGEFEGTFLPSALLLPYAYALPYVEVVLGAALILGVATRPVLMVTALLLISLAFGKVLLKDHATVANNLNYVLIAAVALWFASKDDRYSLQGLWQKWNRGDG